MADYNKLRKNFINTILERVNTENSLKEWIEPPKNSLFPPYSSEMEELAEVCNDVCFNAKQLSTKLEDYVNDLAEGHNFYGEKQLKEYYTELENLFKKFLEYKTKLDEIILMGNSDDNESEMNESEGLVNKNQLSKIEEDEASNTLSVEDKSVELFLDGEPKKIVNCTPHAVTLMLKDGSQVVIPASNNLARCESRRATVYSFDNGVEVHRTEMGDVYGLPEPVDGTYYLVSLLVANKLKGERDDLLVTDEAVRGEDGKIIGCKAFAIV